MPRFKLVRDKVPQIIRDAGGDPLIRIAEPGEFHGLLRAKLWEEVNEFLATDSPDELADILEVLLALANEMGVDLEKLRVAKASERGGFAGRIVWLGNVTA